MGPGVQAQGGKGKAEGFVRTQRERMGSWLSLGSPAPNSSLSVHIKCLFSQNVVVERITVAPPAPSLSQDWESSSPGPQTFYVAEEELELRILLPLPPESWDCRQAPPHLPLVFSLFFLTLIVFGMIMKNC